MAKQLWLNNFDTDLTGVVKALPDTGSPATELGYGIIQLSGAAGTVLPALTDGNWFLLTLFSMSGGLETNLEIVRVTAVDTTSGSETRLTVQRAQEGTTARTYAIGDKVSLRMTAGSATNMLQGSDNLAGLADTAAARTNLGAEAAITSGTTAQYWRGDKTWRDFAADVRAAVLTGLSTATNAAVVATDSVLAAIGKLQKQFTDHFGAGGTAHSNAVAGGAAGFMTGSDKTKLDSVASGATANSSDATLLARANHTGGQAISTVTGLQAALDGTEPSITAGTTAQYWRGDKTWRDFATDVRAAVLTGLSTATSTVADATDTVLSAIGKLQAQVSLRALIASPSFTGTATFQGVRETFITANTGTAYTVANTAGSILNLTLTGNCTFTYPTPASGGQFTLLLAQDATGGRTATWPATVRWPGGTAPTITGTASRTDVISFVSDGTYWLGFVGGQNFTRA
ncbi:hypothetical protein LJR074_001973 [Acidovorax sp. LjRoot74]|uniref:hypothetical protein n=1 Tax=Acidovorax sp. LjRoot74 TaxID=3342337 RepID=UPI003ED05B6C